MVMADDDVLSPGSAGMPGREDRAGWLRHIGINPMDRQPGFTPSRKVREGRKERQRPPLCGSLRLSVLARVVFPDPLASWAKLFRHLGTGFSQGPSSHNALGLQNNKKYYVRSQYVIENKGTLCRKKLKRTHFERQMCRLNPHIELSLHTPVRAGGPRRKHTARFDKEPARGTPQNPGKCRNSGNKARKLLKKKELNFKTNPKETKFGTQTSVSIVCLNRVGSKPFGELDPAISGLSRSQTEVLYKAQQNTKIVGTNSKTYCKDRG